MKLDPESVDDSMFIICAFRYALGRSSYAVSCVANVLCRFMPKMRVNDMNLIEKEIKEAIKKDRAGHDCCDVTEWEHVLTVIKYVKSKG